MNTITASCIAAFILFIIRIVFVLKYPPKRSFSPGQTCRLAVFLGSGGHTSEMLQMLRGLDFKRYEPRTYLVSEGDQFSAAKVAELESGSPSPPHFDIVTIPRARKVLQPLISVPFTASMSLYACLREVTFKPLFNNQSFGDLLLLNGPGTCVPLFIAVFINRVVGLPSPRVLYIESFTRVKAVSLSGRMLRPWVDRFVVQWPALAKGRAHYAGWLI